MLQCIIWIEVYEENLAIHRHVDGKGKHISIALQLIVATLCSYDTKFDKWYFFILRFVVTWNVKPYQ